MDAKQNPKAFYEYATSKTKPKENVGKLKRDDGTLTDNDTEKCQMLNNFFGSVFTHEDSDNVPVFNPDVNSSISSISITSDDMLKQLKDLKINKSPGPDEINPRILYELANELCYPLKYLFDLTMSEGSLPSQ